MDETGNQEELQRQKGKINELQREVEENRAVDSARMRLLIFAEGFSSWEQDGKCTPM
jgi:hypothetical protein